MISGILGRDINFVLWVQSWGASFAAPMRFFSFLGSEQFFLLVAPAIYWCLDKRLGIRLGLYLSISAAVNFLFKLVLHSPRPYWIDRRVSALATESSFGLPSGHAQNAAAVWGSLAAGIGSGWVWILSILIMLLIGISRLYLGVHFLSDVLLGWLLGALLLWGMLKFEPIVLTWLKRRRFLGQAGAAFIASLLIIGMAVLIRWSLADWILPQEWIDNAAAAAPGAEPINPLSLEGLISNAAVFFGLSVGVIWLSIQGSFTTSGTWWQLLLRYVIGLLGVLVVWMGLDMLFPDGEDILSFALRYLRYALTGLWVGGLAPWVFLKLRLAEKDRG